jgi:hypothetical protein
MSKIYLWKLCVYVVCAFGATSSIGAETAPKFIDLAGDWSVQLDPNNVGIEKRWFADRLAGDDIVGLPGSLQEQGYGDKPGMETPWVGNIRQEEWAKPKYAPYRTAENFKMPFWLQPDRYYSGPAWYQRTVEIPEGWKGQQITLELERPHWETRVWVDNSLVGVGRSLATPHSHVLTGFLEPGTHRLTIRVDNSMIIDIGPNSHSISDHTQSNWNGIVGDLKLSAQPEAFIADIQIYPDLDARAVRIVSSLALARGATGPIEADLIHELVYQGAIVASAESAGIEISKNQLVLESVLTLDQDVKKWDEFEPNLYTLRSRLAGSRGIDEDETTFGFRKLGIDGTRFTINDREVFMRGTLECAIFPLTGYPPTDVASWKRIIQICKDHGLNHMRFHSWCPPEAAFIAADELGFYLQVECSVWANQGVEPGIGLPLDQWLYEEAALITRAYANHPSFVLMAHGNEPGGRRKQTQEDFLADWYQHWKENEPRVLHASGSGWPLISESDFYSSPDPRVQRWGEGLNSIINSGPPNTRFDFSEFVEGYRDKPTVAHEIGQWCVFPNFEETRKYTGVLKARNFEIFEAFLQAKGLLGQAKDFLMASGKLQVIAYKADIEASLRTPGFGGFQLLDLRDFPGQGTALVGVLDPFWDSKPYVTAEEYRRFSGPIVPLARLDKRSFSSRETLRADLELSHFGAIDLEDPVVRYALLDRGGEVVRQGALPQKALAAGGLYPLGSIEIDLSGLPAPAAYSLEVSVGDTSAVNDWDVWVYPDTPRLESDEVLISNTLDTEVIQKLANGGKVLLTVRPDSVQTDVALGFSPIFWNTAWTRKQAPHTLGVLCDPEHPALADFPTEYHSNWQWSLPIQNAATMELDGLPQALEPIIQIVPDWFEPRKLALAFEADVNGGKLLVTSIDLESELDGELERKQLRASFLQYMEGDSFSPKVSLSPKDIHSIFKKL